MAAAKVEATVVAKVEVTAVAKAEATVADWGSS